MASVAIRPMRAHVREKEEIRSARKGEISGKADAHVCAGDEEKARDGMYVQ